MRSKGFFSLLFALSTIVCGQSGFILPVKHAVYLTGNYGEIRPNHFHAGLDFRTDVKEHLPIYCIGDGYVSRIKVGTHGYGKVLYITHANGKVSVYGHQYSFNETIKKYAQAAQEMLETFEVELFPKPGELKVKQGELIGYSGNTGDSEGAHLHFEIRDEKSEVPLNPLRFLNVVDTVAPTLKTIAIYEDDYTVPRLISIKDTTDTLRVPLKVGIGVECFDVEQAGGNRNNIYAIELIMDRFIYHRQVLDSIPFDMARYVNTYCDYDLKREKKIKVQKCFMSKNDDLPIYKNGHSGFIYLEDTLYHELKVKVYDYYRHSAEARFTLKRIPPTKMKPIVNYPVNCLSEWETDQPQYSIDMLEKTLYKDVLMKDSMGKGVLYFYAKDYSVPFHKSVILSMKPAEEQKKFSDKLCIVDAGGAYYSSAFEQGWVNTTTKNFGTYKIVIDTAAPKIKFVKPRSKKKRKIYKNGDIINFQVGDDISGIGVFKMYVDDKFFLSEYEHKTGMIFFEINEKIARGKVKVRLELRDKKNNLAVSEATIDVE